MIRIGPIVTTDGHWAGLLPARHGFVINEYVIHDRTDHVSGDRFLVLNGPGWQTRIGEVLRRAVKRSAR